MSRRKSTHMLREKFDLANNDGIVLDDSTINISDQQQLPVVNVDKLPGATSTCSSAEIPTRRSVRTRSPSKRYSQHYISGLHLPHRRAKAIESDASDECDLNESEPDSEDDLKLESDEEAALVMLGKKVSATTLFEEQMDVAGEHVYGFCTPKKRDSMSALALSSVQRTPKTSASTACIRNGSPGVIPKTPMHVRRIEKREISKMLNTSMRSDFSASDSDFVPSSEDEVSESDSGSSNDDDDDDGEVGDIVEEEQKENASCPVRRHLKSAECISVRSAASTLVQSAIPVPRHLNDSKYGSMVPIPTLRSHARRDARQKEELEYIVQSDEYFSTHTSSKAATSDHTLDRLNTPRLPQEVLFRLLKETRTSRAHTTAIHELLAEYEQQFSRWMFLLNEGFNVLLYGLGSKRSLLQSFHRKVLSERPVLVVNGYFPALTVKDVVEGVASGLLDLRLATANHHEMIDAIERELSYLPDMHIFLLVHNLDGVAMRHGRMQTTLCRLASIPNVHLIATIDHINAPLLWDASMLSHYNFCWWDVTTLLPYGTETAYENSLLVQNSGAPTLSSMRSVFASLTSNARGIFMAIVKYQLTNGGPASPHYAGMLLKDLYWTCREAFLVSSDIALRAQLTEFIDHKLLRVKRSVDGAENLLLPIEHSLLQRFIDETQQGM